TFDGGAGTDQLIYSGINAVSEGVTVTPGATLYAGQVSSVNTASNDAAITVANFTTVEGVLVNGNNGAAGDTDTVTVTGTAGDDVLHFDGSSVGFAGAVNTQANIPIFVNGLAGNDTIVVQNLTVPLTVDGGDGIDTVVAAG